MKFQNYLSKKIILSTTAALLLSGCFGGKVVLKQERKQIPSWYLNAPINNSLFIYGEGKADSIQEAKDNALNSMASKLIVSVGSSVNTVTKTSRDNYGSSYSKDMKKDLKIDVQKVKFTNATVEKSSNIGDSFYILMKVNRQELFDNKKKEFDINDKSITSKFNSLKNYKKLEQVHILQDIYPNIINGKKQAIVLNTINNEFDHGVYLSKYDSFIDKIFNLKNNSTIKVQTNSKEKYFADGLIDLLNQQKYKVTTSTKGDILIKINNKVKYNLARGWNIAKVSTTLSVISNDKIVSNKIITTLGRSSTSKESALENASNEFVKKIKTETLDKVIFSK
ncbi:MAG: LPP20 family lipoprotein [Campylobacterota bacterium]|nr:LPP20 family lipoprotein [Campylobacterota bacterium]